MGLRIRKSIKLGKHLKLNLSKSGVSVSGGIRGARVSLNTKGVVRRSVGIPGTGVYYQDQHKIKAKQQVKQIKQQQSQRIDKVKKVYVPSNTKKVRLIPITIISMVLCGFGLGAIGVSIFVGSLIWNNGVNHGRW